MQQPELPWDTSVIAHTRPRVSSTAMTGDPSAKMEPVRQAMVDKGLASMGVTTESRPATPRTEFPVPLPNYLRSIVLLLTSQHSPLPLKHADSWPSS